MTEIKCHPVYTNYAIDITTREGKCTNLLTGHELSNKPTGTNCKRIMWAFHVPKDRKTHTQQAARWIAETYPELVQNEYFEGAEIDHIDTDPMNNHPSNLRWVTHKANQNNPLTKQHMSEWQVGRVLPQETIEKIRKANTGRVKTEEERKKLSEARQGEKHPFYGKHHTEETKQKIREGVKRAIQR